MITSAESIPEADRPDRRRRARPTAFSLTLTTISGIVLLLVSVPNLTPAIRAGMAEGTPGTFVAAQRSCIHHLSHQSCSWRGTFKSLDGREQRRDTYLYGNAELQRGQKIPAIDVGRPGQVYAGPSHEWMLTAVLLLAGCVFLLLPPARITRARFGSGVRRERRLGHPE